MFFLQIASYESIVVVPSLPSQTRHLLKITVSGAAKAQQGGAVMFTRKRIYALTSLIAVVLVLIAGSALADEITLAWDANIEPDLAGYWLYYGQSSGVYTDSVDVGTDTACMVTGLPDGQLRYFAVKAYDIYGQKSDFSNEVLKSSSSGVYVSSDTLTLKWPAMDVGEDYYVIYRNTDQACFTPSSNNSIGATTETLCFDMVAADPNDYFYVVRGLSGVGHILGYSVRMGKIASSLQSGYDIVSYILDQGCVKGVELGKKIPNCTKVLRWDTGSGGWVYLAWKSGITWYNYGNVSLGNSYLVSVTASGIWVQAGILPADPTFSLNPGNNLITLPYKFVHDKGIVTGGQLGASISGCTKVWRWNTVTGNWKWVAYYTGSTWWVYENVEPGKAYLVYATIASNWPDSNGGAGKIAASAKPQESTANPLLPELPMPPDSPDQELAEPAPLQLPTYALFPNHPNPFNTSTVIRYQLPTAQKTSIVIYNILGQTVNALISEKQTAGFYSLIWDGRNAQGEPVGSGVYVVRLQAQAGEFSQTQKIVLLR
ncbi:T9SS type A sorting domain-containing protein [Patescibacteria group bacterium]|nr:T9SS type A sorting domain-containing protein [Patescibacteria group bacterium]MBU4512484.1 T9SS type A sorting domain-containing protein [Patescibacteria group bacterium]MCG2692810.1 T9SS type A sorting domain-containing protein [Candidatus Parcubacteria bacterium]